MHTFNKALDLIEFEGRRSKDTFLLKLNLTNLARVGHAMLDRAEWEGELLNAAPQAESEARQ